MFLSCRRKFQSAPWKCRWGGTPWVVYWLLALALVHQTIIGRRFPLKKTVDLSIPKKGTLATFFPISPFLLYTFSSVLTSFKSFVKKNSFDVVEDDFFSYGDGNVMYSSSCQIVNFLKKKKNPLSLRKNLKNVNIIHFLCCREVSAFVKCIHSLENGSSMTWI